MALLSRPAAALVALIFTFSLLTRASTGPALPNARQLDFMELEFTQFMHFGVDTAWDAPDSFLRGANPTYHNCEKRWVGVDHGNQTQPHYPCLNAEIFKPEKLDPEQWMEASKVIPNFGASACCALVAPQLVYCC